MSETLRIQQYSHSGVLGMQLSKEFPADWNTVCKEAYTYLNEKHSKCCNDSGSQVFNHQDVDVCEKLLIINYKPLSVMITLDLIFTELKSCAYDGYYGSLGKTAAEGGKNMNDALCCDVVCGVFSNLGKNFSAVTEEFNPDEKEMLEGILHRVHDYYKMMSARYETNSREEADEFIRFGEKMEKKQTKAAPKPMEKVVSIEPEESKMLENITIFKAREMSCGSAISSKLKVLYAKELIRLAAKESSDSAAADLLEKTAWFDDTAHNHTGEIVQSLRDRLSKSGCMEEKKFKFIGTVGQKYDELRHLYFSAPDTEMLPGERIKYMIFGLLALAAAAIIQFTPLHDLLYNNDAPYIIIIVATVLSIVLGAITLGGMSGAVIGLIPGIIVGYICTITMYLLPAIVAAVALVFFFKAFRTTTPMRKKFDQYMQKNEFSRKADELEDYVKCVKTPFGRMDNCAGLGDIRAYYDKVLQGIHVFRTRS